MPGQRAPRPAIATCLLAAVTLICATVGRVGAAGPASAVTLPPPSACADTISTVTGTVTSPPAPLPVPTSSVGGARLSVPGLQLDLARPAARPPALRATAWLVADLDTADVLASCNAHVPLAPASTLKILTSLALAHRLDWRARYTGRPADATTDGSKVGIVPGSTYSVADLFHGLMLSSGNDAATALATLSGGMAATTALMNTEARRLGGFDTSAVNDSGLDAPGQITSAYDLALFGQAALADPLVSALVSTQTYQFPGAGDRQPRPSFQIQNHNALLRTYPGATGVKNGYTTAAGGSYVGSAGRGGHRYLVSVLRAEGGTWHLAKELLDWAFTAGPAARPVGRLVLPGERVLGEGVPGEGAAAERRRAAATAGAANTSPRVRVGDSGAGNPTGWAGPAGLAGSLALATGCRCWWQRRRRRSAPEGLPQGAQSPAGGP